MKNKLVTLCFSRIYPHYRHGLFKSLIRNIDDFYIGYEPFNSRGIKQIDIKDFYNKIELDRFFQVKNYEWKDYLFFQLGVLKKVIFKNFDVAIFLGDIKVISTWISLIICRFKNKRTLLWTHGLKGDESWLKEKLLLWLFKLSSALFYMKESLKNF